MDKLRYAVTGRFVAPEMEPIRRDVLDKGYVELIDIMGDDDAPVDGARVSFAKRADQYTEAQNDKLFKYLVDHAHGSPTEMTEFKFRIKAPVVVWWHWVRHRIGSFNFMSGRYVPFEEDEVYAPVAWRMQSASNKQGSDPNKELDPVLSSLFSQERNRLYEQCYSLYSRMLDAGVAREQARLALPFAAVYYEAIWKVNGRSLTNFLSLREGLDAQEEIRKYAKAIHGILSGTHPRLFPVGPLKSC